MIQVAHQTAASQMLNFRRMAGTYLRRVPDERGYNPFGAPRTAWELGDLGKVEGREVVHEAVVDLAPRVESGLKRSVYFASGAATKSHTASTEFAYTA